MTAIVSVNGLRKLGYKVRVTHFRKYRNYINGKIKIDELPNHVADVKYALPRGGRIEVVIVDENSNEFLGVTRCNESDGYDKKLGVQLAITRAMEKLLISKTQA